MFRNLGILVIAILAASTAFGGASLDLRMDYKSYSSNDKMGSAPYAAFQVQRARLLMKGGLGESTDYTLRLNLLGTATTPAAAATVRDNVSKFVDYAFITRKFSDEFSLSLGKIILGMGGVEALNNPADFYLVSTAGAEVGSFYWAGGLALDMKFDDHMIKVAMANNTEDVADSAKGNTFNQTRTLAGVVYNAKFMDGMIAPNLSYYTEQFVNTGGGKESNNYMAVGAKIKADPVTVELDYLNNKYSTDPKATGDKSSTNSIVALLRYGFMEASSAHVKFETSTSKALDAALNDEDTKVTGTTLAFEYKPSKDENWRSHVAVTDKSSKTGTADAKTERAIMIGMRMVADILK